MECSYGLFFNGDKFAFTGNQQWLICWFMLVVVPVSFEEEYSQGNT